MRAEVAARTAREPRAPTVDATAATRPFDERGEHRASAVNTVLMTADAVGGVWRYAIDLARGLGDRGVRTTIAVMGPPPSAGQRREADAAGVHLVDRPYRLEWMDDPWDDVKRAGDWLLALERTLRPDVVHLNGYSHAKLPWSVPVVVVAHSCVRTWWTAVKGEPAPGRLGHYTDEIAAGLAAAAIVVAPTSAMLDALSTEYGRPPRVQVIPNGCAAAEHAELPIAGKEKLVLSAGRVWDEAKNIGALSAVAHELPWPVHVAGECREPGKSDGGRPPVQLLGCLAPQELAAWYRRAAIYTLPARYEPFGLSVLEAATAGCALVLGDIRSLRENWDGAALFVPADDHRALGAAIRRLIEEPGTRTELARRAFARASGFTLRRTTDEYLRVYESLT
jgi:glycosyltransferase involved in cell wall biosynthesis